VASQKEKRARQSENEARSRYRDCRHESESNGNLSFDRPSARSGQQSLLPREITSKRKDGVSMTLTATVATAADR
jgi:hypothetical protein